MLLLCHYECAQREGRSMAACGNISVTIVVVLRSCFPLDHERASEEQAEFLKHIFRLAHRLMLVFSP